MMNHNNIADNIKRLREARRMTQEQLANELGVTFQAVSKWENGVTMPDVIAWKRIVDELIVRGFTYEVEWPRQMMNEAKAKS